MNLKNVIDQFKSVCNDNGIDDGAELTDDQKEELTDHLDSALELLDGADEVEEEEEVVE